jgi:hypothetical protein
LVKEFYNTAKDLGAVPNSGGPPLLFQKVNFAE